jgi:hypothetical protein
MGVLLLVPVLLILGVGYLVGALAFKDFVSARYTHLGGFLGAIGLLAIVAGVIYAGCSSMRF